MAKDRAELEYDLKIATAEYMAGLAKSDYGALIVGKAKIDVLRRQLEQAESTGGSGAPGRPSSMRLVLAEAHRRREAGLSKERVRDEASTLKIWFDLNHSGEPNLTAKTIENKIREDHKANGARA